MVVIAESGRGCIAVSFTHYYVVLLGRQKALEIYIP